MKDAPYMSSNEMVDFLKIGILASEAEVIAERTTVKAWRKALKTCATLCGRITTERAAALDASQIKSVDRRFRHTKILLKSTDEQRVAEGAEKTVTLDCNDLYDVLDGCLLHCCTCEQGERVKGCRRREIYHRLGVEPLRFEPEAGECEFRSDNEPYAVTVGYRRDDTLTLFGIGTDAKEK